MRKKIAKIYIWLGAVAVIYSLWYAITGIGIPCFYLSTRGYECPGCGLSRMMFSLMTFRFGNAFVYNQVGFVAFFLWNAVAGLCWWGKVELVKKPAFLYSLLTVTMVAFLIQGLVRNLYYHS